MTDPLVTLRVYGDPGTAGSKSAFPLWRTRPDGSRELVRVLQVEKDRKKVKANWREAVLAAAHNLIIDPATEKFRFPYPLDEALAAALVFTVKKPVGAPRTVRTWPAVRPDVLKYARAFEDALQAAGLLKDDARIVDYRRLAKVYPGEDPDALEVPGALLRIWRMIDLPGWQRHAVVTGASADVSLFDEVMG